jgi:hypothetical protein
LAAVPKRDVVSLFQSDSVEVQRFLEVLWAEFAVNSLFHIV